MSYSKVKHLELLLDWDRELEIERPVLLFVFTIVQEILVNVVRKEKWCNYP